MANSPPSPSTSVEIEPPVIATPSWPPAPPDKATPIWPVPPPHVPTFHFTSIQFSSPHPRSQVHFASAPPGGTVSFQPDPMQLCTSTETSSPSSVLQHRLTGHLPTPGKEIHQLTAHIQENWGHLFDRLKQQEKAVRELTQESAKSISLHDAKLATLAAKMETNHQQILDMIAVHKQDEEGSSDQLIKAMKVMVTGELQKHESTLILEVRFMVEQVQRELQRDMQATQENSRKDCEQLSKEISHCTTQLYALCNDFKDLQLEISNYTESLEKAGVDQPLPAPISAHDTGPSSAPPSEAASIQQPRPAVKSDYLNFPNIWKTIRRC